MELVDILRLDMISDIACNIYVQVETQVIDKAKS